MSVLARVKTGEAAEGSTQSDFGESRGFRQKVVSQLNTVLQRARLRKEEVEKEVEEEPHGKKRKRKRAGNLGRKSKKAKGMQTSLFEESGDHAQERLTKKSVYQRKIRESESVEEREERLATKRKDLKKKVL